MAPLCCPHGMRRAGYIATTNTPNEGHTLSIRKNLAVLLVIVAAGTGIGIIPGSPAAASTVLCTTGVTADGTGDTWMFMPGLSSGSTNCSEYYNDDNHGVQFLQDAINQCYGAAVIGLAGHGGYYPLQEDSIFGPATRAALRLVQAKIHATVDGSYGPETKSKMQFPNELGPCFYWVHDLPT